LDFRLSQGSVATYCRWGGNLRDVYKFNGSERQNPAHWVG